MPICGKMTDAQLVGLQTSSSDWHARRARVILQNRAAKRTLKPETHEQLRRMFRPTRARTVRLRAMWALHVTGGWTPDALVQALGDRGRVRPRLGGPAALRRSIAVRRSRSRSSPGWRAKIARRSCGCTSPSALQRMDHAARWTIAGELMMHGEDAADHNLPKMLWLAVEPLVKENPALALERAAREPRSAGGAVHRAPGRRRRCARTARRRDRQGADDADQPAGRHAGRARGTVRPDRAVRTGRRCSSG